MSNFKTRAFFDQDVLSYENVVISVENWACTEPSCFSSLFNIPYSKDIHSFSPTRLVQLYAIIKHVFILAPLDYPTPLLLLTSETRKYTGGQLGSLL